MHSSVVNSSVHQQTSEQMKGRSRQVLFDVTYQNTSSIMKGQVQNRWTNIKIQKMSYQYERTMRSTKKTNYDFDHFIEVYLEKTSKNAIK